MALLFAASWLTSVGPRKSSAAPFSATHHATAHLPRPPILLSSEPTCNGHGRCDRSSRTVAFPTRTPTCTSKDCGTHGWDGIWMPRPFPNHGAGLAFVRAHLPFPSNRPRGGLLQRNSAERL